VTVAAGSETDSSFSSVVVGDLSADNYDVTVSSADDSATGTLTVLAVEVISIDIDGQGPDATIDEGTGPISVNGTLENFNTVDENRDVTVTISDETGTVSETDTAFGVQDGETRVKTFDVDTSGLSAGDYEVTVATPQTNATGQIEIAPTNAQIDSVEFDDGNSASDTATILGSFLNAATEVVSSVTVDFGNIAGNVGLGNVGAGTCKCRSMARIGLSAMSMSVTPARWVSN
jgi:hypothetical protein